MKYRVFLSLAITLLALDIFFMLSGRFSKRLDYQEALHSLNALFALFTAFVFYVEIRRLHRQDKLPVSISVTSPVLQFSDQLLIGHFPELLCLKDKDGRWLNASPTYLQAFKLSATDYYGKTDLELAQQPNCDVKELQASVAIDKQAWQQGFQSKTLITVADDEFFETTHTPVFDSEQNRFRMIITGRPASDFDKKRSRLEILDQALDASPIAYALLDQDFHVLESSHAFAELTGFQSSELEKKPIAMIFVFFDQAKAPKEFFDLAPGESKRREFECRHKSGRIFPARMEISALDRNGKDKVYFVTFNDLSEQKQLEKRVGELSSHDDLTGLANRQLLLERLGQFLSTSGRYGLHAALLYIDLDRFRSINDSLGHDSGDELLKMTAKRLIDITRKGDVVARLSGDEFAVLMLNDKNHDRAIYAASLVAKKIIHTLSESYYLRRRDIYIGASVGISIFPEDGAAPEVLLKNADFAMNEVKKTGRNNYQFYRKDHSVAVRDRLSMELSLRKAISNNELQLYFQPQYLAKDGLLCGAEVLIRWFQETMGETKMVPPGFFIPVAEDSGLIVDIGKWILKTSCEQMRDWLNEGILLPQVSVNISARQFSDPNFLDIVERALSDSGLPPEYLELEITESMLIGDIKRIELQLKRLKKMGIKLALDDFGTGYSSLSYLKNFPVDVLKIDQSFIREMIRDSRDANIARAIIEMGHSLGQKVVAEGVETEEQLHYLVRRECDIIQGYYFSPPLPVHKMSHLLDTQKDKIGRPSARSLFD